MLSWLKQQELYPKLFWQSKGSKEALAAVGSSHDLQTIPTDPSKRYFGGITFSPDKREPLWHAFPPCYFFAPLIEKKAKAIADLPFTKPTLLDRKDAPSYEEWERLVVQILQTPQLEKVVLARCTTLTFKETLCPWELLSKLKTVSRNATLFGFQITPEAAFIGASPEKLYSRNERKLLTEALAGTRLKGAEGLGDKERHEFGFVKTSIAGVLHHLSVSVQAAPVDEIIQTAHLEHFYNPFSAVLKSNVSDADLLRALHPTAAMGGHPRAQALQFLVENEPFDRGWYASPIGWMGPGGAEMVVGIRSALVSGCKLHLFAGAGIVTGSDPRKEWEELNHKIEPFMRMFS